MDFSILYAIQSIRCAWLDTFKLIVTKVAGNNGELWIVLGIILLAFRKTRRTGIVILMSYILTYLIGQCGLKELIARPRPCHIDKTVKLLIKCPESYSCPSTHSAWAFAGATSVFMYHKKCGIFVAVISCIIAFSRMYMFVHFPTDVAFGAIIGILCGLLAWFVVNKISTMKK